MTSPYFEAGGITLWHGDALAVLAAMPAASVDAVITDPPYSSGGAFRADREHQTQKPLDVMRELMAVVPQGGTVCDPFMGSGTTGVAAVIEGHRFVGVEQHAHYIDVARDRIAAVVDGTPPGSGQGVLL